VSAFSAFPLCNHVQFFIKTEAEEAAMQAHVPLLHPLPLARPGRRMKTNSMSPVFGFPYQDTAGPPSSAPTLFSSPAPFRGNGENSVHDTAQDTSDLLFGSVFTAGADGHGHYAGGHDAHGHDADRHDVELGSNVFVSETPQKKLEHKSLEHKSTKHRMIANIIVSYLDGIASGRHTPRNLLACLGEQTSFPFGPDAFYFHKFPFLLDVWEAKEKDLRAAGAKLPTETGSGQIYGEVLLAALEERFEDAATVKRWCNARKPSPLEPLGVTLNATDQCHHHTTTTVANKQANNNMTAVRSFKVHNWIGVIPETPQKKRSAGGQ